MEGGKRAHAAMLPLPLAGHINPMMHLAFLLASKGLVVTFVNTESNRKSTIASSPRPEWDIRFVYIPDGLSPDDGCTDLPALLDSFYTHACPAFEELLCAAGAHDPPISCVIANTFIALAQASAKKLNLPFVSFWTQSAASYASTSMVAQGFRPHSAEPSSLITSIPGVPPLRHEETISFLQCYDPQSFMFNVFVRPFETITQSDWVLMNTFEELEGDTIEAMRKQLHPVLPVGPLLPSCFFYEEKEVGSPSLAPLTEEEDRCIAWLDKQEAGSVVYVSFGSLAVMSAEQISEIALGLEGSGHRFLWVVRRGLMRGEKAAELPEGFAERTRERGLIVSWAPQLRVLSHGAVGGFFTHCGWNSTLEGISAGVPLLGWWSFSDQALNCKLAEAKWKVGMALERSPIEESGGGLFGESGGTGGGLVKREEVQEKVSKLMGGPQTHSLKAMASHWKEGARQAVVHPGGSSAQSILRFVQDMEAKACTLKLPSLSG